MRSAVMLINPAAGRYAVKPFIRLAVKELEAASWRVDPVETQSGHHTVALARQAAAEGREAVFAVGGDGTIGNVVNGLVGTETALGVLPAGTANVWGYELGLPAFSWLRPWVLRRNASVLARAPGHWIDVGACNEYAFMLWTGIGLDALTIHSLEPRLRLEKFFSVPQYAARTIWNASQWGGVRLRLWADGQAVEGHYIVAVTTNIRHYLGGHSKLSPDAYLDDGLLDIWLFSGNNLGDALRHAYDMWRGRHLSSEAARCITFSELRVEGEAPFRLQMDGEPRGSAQTAEMRVRTRALKLLTPPGALDLLKYK